MNHPITHPHILLMKVGPYLNYSLDEIIKIKQKEQKEIGMFYWGYSGVFCRPNIINAFLSHASISHTKPLLLFVTTKSSYTTSTGGKFTDYSIDNSSWKPIPKKVLLVGNKQAKHFAVTGTNLKKVNAKVNLSDYCSYSGIFPNSNNYLDNYFRYRVDKACGFYLPKRGSEPKYIDIQYTSELVEPFTVYIK